jgi:hypothetical protein
MTSDEIAASCHTADDIARARLALMDWKDHMERVDGGLGFKAHRVIADRVAVAITFRAIELGIEEH